MKTPGLPEPTSRAGLAGSPSELNFGDATAELWTRRVFVILGLYFLARVFVRVAISATPEMDESEQLIQTQAWAWGYGPQPPLYTWIQKLVFAGLGSNLLALALLKNALLFATCFMTERAGRELTGHRAGGLFALLGLFCVPHFVWASQNDLTHSILAILLVACTVWCITKLMQTKSSAVYALLGVLIATGVLSKYNYIAFLLALIAAMTSIRESRGIVLNWKMAGTLALALILLAPHLVWMRHHPELAFRKFQGLHAASQDGLFQSWIHGFGTLATSLVPYFVPLAAACGLAHKRWPRFRDFWPGFDFDPDVRVRVAMRLVGISIGAFLLAVMLFRAQFKERWIHPNLFVLPLLLGSVRSNWNPTIAKRLIGITAVIAFLVFLILPGRVLFASATHQPHRQNLPYDALVDQAFSNVPAPLLVIASPNALAGAVKLRNPALRVVTPLESPPLEHDGGPALILWDTSIKNSGGSIEKVLGRFGIPESALDSVRYTDAPLKFVPTQRLQMAYVFVPVESRVPANVAVSR